MKSQIIRNKIKEIIKSNFNWLTEIDLTITNKSLRDDLGLDSIGIVNLQVSIEDEFDIRFNPLETDFATVFYSIDSVVEFISKYTK